MVLHPVSLTPKFVILIYHPPSYRPALGLPIQQTGPFSPSFFSFLLFVMTPSCEIMGKHLVQEPCDRFFKVPKSFQITCILWFDSRCLGKAGWQKDQESGPLVQIPPLPPITSLILIKSITQSDPRLSLLRNGYDCHLFLNFL